jgi:hypothetical protein
MVDVTPERQQLMDLAARVPEADIPVARRVLQALIVDPFWLSLQAAPFDDEELTPEAIASLDEHKPSSREAKGFPTRKSCVNSESSECRHA